VLFIRQRSDLLDNIISTGRIGGGNKKLGEHKAARRTPGSRLPEFPGLGLGVNKVIEDSFLVKVGLMLTDLGKRSISLLKDLTVETLTFLSLEKTTESPGETIDEVMLEVLLGNSLNIVVLRESSLKE
jgi:hypothetical protein